MELRLLEGERLVGDSMLQCYGLAGDCLKIYEMSKCKSWQLECDWIVEDGVAEEAPDDGSSSVVVEELRMLCAVLFRPRTRCKMR